MTAAPTPPETTVPVSAASIISALVNEPTTAATRNSAEANPESTTTLAAPPAGRDQPTPSTTRPLTNQRGLRGFIFVDKNGDGQQNADEPSLPSVTVEVRSSTGALSGTTSTDTDGRFSMPVESEGTYSVTIVGGVPPEYSFLTDQTIWVQVLGNDFTKSEAVFRVNSSVDELAFTGGFNSRMLVLALGCLLTGTALLGSRHIKRQSCPLG